MEPKLRILMLEDAASDAELEIQALKHVGMSCDWRRVQTEGDFVAQIEQFDPHLILSDFTLPSFDGLSALRLAREKCPDVPFIVVSGTIGAMTIWKFHESRALAATLLVVQGYSLLRRRQRPREESFL